jgi:microcystin-dependent protein
MQSSYESGRMNIQQYFVSSSQHTYERQFRWMFAFDRSSVAIDPSNSRRVTVSSVAIHSVNGIRSFHQLQLHVVVQQLAIIDSIADGGCSSRHKNMRMYFSLSFFRLLKGWAFNVQQ